MRTAVQSSLFEIELDVALDPQIVRVWRRNAADEVLSTEELP